jgi:hypothetical protein
MIDQIFHFWQSMYDKSADKQGQMLLERIESLKGFGHWGLIESYSKFSPGHIRVIYDSEWGRIKFRYRHGHYLVKAPKMDEFSIDYGRLHAPDDQADMIWQGQKCNCWHNNRLALFFLDGFAPQDVVQREKEGSWHCDVEADFRQSEFGKQLIENKLWAEIWIQSEAVIWQHYGQRLFEVFDLRRPDLWDAYSEFHGEYHRLKGTVPPSERIAHLVAPQTQIC